MLAPVQYPLSVDAFVSSVQYLTDVTPIGNGRDYRIARWDDGKVSFDALQDVRSLKDLHTFLSFFRRRKGRARAFVVRDMLDYQQSWDGSLAPIGLGTNNISTKFQLSKTYQAADDDEVEVRTIYKAEYGTIHIYVDGTEETHFTFTNGYQGRNHDTNTNYLCTVDGQFTFNSGHVPALNAVIEAKFNFFQAVNFAEDKAPLDEIQDLLAPDPNDNTKWILPASAGGNLPKVMMIGTNEI